MIIKVENSQQLHDCQLELHYASRQMTYYYFLFHFSSRSQLPGILFGPHNVDIYYWLYSPYCPILLYLWGGFISQITQNTFFGDIYEGRSLLKNIMVWQTL